MTPPPGGFVTATIPVGGRPYGLVMAPDGAHVYVVNQTDDTVSVIATATNTVVATISVGDGTGTPSFLAITPDGARVYVPGGLHGNVKVIATATNTVVATIPVSGTVGSWGAWGCAITPDGARVYVTNSGADTVSVIATATNTVVATIAVGDLPQYAAVTPDGAHVWVSNYSDNNISVIDVATNTVVHTIAALFPGGVGIYGIAFSPDGTRAYVTSSEQNAPFPGNKVAVLNTATYATVTTITSSHIGPYDLAVSPDGAFVWVGVDTANAAGPSFVDVVDAATNQIVSAITVGSSADGIRFTPDGAHVYVANWNDGTVSVIAVR